jgi:hypothetical protein
MKNICCKILENNKCAVEPAIEHDEATTIQYIEQAQRDKTGETRSM